MTELAPPRDDRGSIVEMTVTVQYPDGSTKTVTYDRDWCLDTGAILMHESCMTLEQLDQYNAADQWENRPTFLQVHRQKVDRLGCGGQGGQWNCTDCCACTSCPN
jgi:hypothetical protein